MKETLRRVMRPATLSRWTFDRTRPGRHFQRLGEQIQHAIQSGETVLQRRGAAGEGRDRPEQGGEVREEHHQIADGQRLLGGNQPGFEFLHVAEHAAAAPVEKQGRGERG